MKTMLRTALAALSISSISPAFAGENGDVVANTFFTLLPSVIAQPPAQNAPAVMTAQRGQAVQANVTNSRGGTWLFPPNGNEGANN